MANGDDYSSMNGWMMTRINGRAWEKKFLVLADFELSSWKSELMREEDSVSPHRLDLQSLECLNIEMDHGRARKNVDSVCLLMRGADSQNLKIQFYHSDDAEETRVWFHILDFIIFGRVATQQQLEDLSEDAQERILAVQGGDRGGGVDVSGGGVVGGGGGFSQVNQDGGGTFAAGNTITSSSGAGAPPELRPRANPGRSKDQPRSNKPRNGRTQKDRQSGL